MTTKPYQTTEVTVSATDGTPITLVVPTSLPSDERADYLRKLYSEHVRPVKPGDSWKAECCAVVPVALESDVAQAMYHMGSIVDERRHLLHGIVVLYSRGYWAHGF